MVVKTCVFMVGSWMTLVPMRRSGDADAFGKHVVQGEQTAARLIAHPARVVVEMHVAHAVRREHRPVLVGALAHAGVHDHRAVVSAEDGVRGESVGEQRAGDAVELPGCGGAGGIPVMPRDVDLERGFGRRVQVLAVTGAAHGVGDVVEDRFGTRANEGDGGHGNLLSGEGCGVRNTVAQEDLAPGFAQAEQL